MEDAKEKSMKRNGSVENEQSQQPPAKKKKKNPEHYPFGNYRHYYGYRIEPGSEEDPRLKVLKKEWFEDKECLDIGCNAGLITIAIAKKFCCRSILGIDIDRALINDAYWNLRRIARMGTVKKPPQTENSKDHEQDGEKNEVAKPGRGKTNQISEDSSASVFFDKVSFKAENIVEHWFSPEADSYDTILCLSVTKWVHLNWGDDGLITLFTKIWKLLRPGGILILEPQPWNSYEKKKNRLVSQVTQTNCKNIKIFPESFQEILLDKIGFRLIENITSGLASDTKSGFKRPILALWK